ncbi:site-2 protease family protein, partial [Candidatus Microgenomates bacterium]|nr:site-2 protease family protein [Candidatus Microgenomates bacterium]
MVLTAVIVLLTLSILIIVHEFGHFIVGKINGIKIEEFALGLPFTKPIVSKTFKDGMKISLYPLLFGGFVKLLGEEKDERTHNSFSQKNVYQRMSVVVAGVTMNFILAIVTFYLFLALSGFKVLVPRLADYKFRSPNQTLIAITFVQKDSPADKIGLVPGDILRSADDEKFSKMSDFQNYAKQQAGREIKLQVTDSLLSKVRVLTVTPRKNPPAGQGPLGVGI